MMCLVWLKCHHKILLLYTVVDPFSPTSICLVKWTNEPNIHLFGKPTHVEQYIQYCYYHMLAPPPTHDLHASWSLEFFWAFELLNSITHSRVLVCFNCSNVLSNWTDSAFSMLPVYKELISAGLKIWVFRYAALLLLSFNLPHSMHRIHTFIPLFSHASSPSRIMQMALNSGRQMSHSPKLQSTGRQLLKVWIILNVGLRQLPFNVL